MHLFLMFCPVIGSFCHWSVVAEFGDGGPTIIGELQVAGNQNRARLKYGEVDDKDRVKDRLHQHLHRFGRCGPISVDEYVKVMEDYEGWGRQYDSTSFNCHSFVE